ncbi:MAG: response regulator [Thaumarchaeota archaeon]|nr:response regulator [Nitrososphaerota archaeon]MBI3639176.1 response regulator [Nitrososphaerota archaeon]
MSDNKNEVEPTTAIVIDDDHDAVDVICEYLELMNIHVLGKGYNGKDAVDMYLRFRPGVVFLDVMMPDYDGIYALEKIKQISPRASIIIITADQTEERENQLVELGASEIIYKPFELNNLKIIGSKK